MLSLGLDVHMAQSTSGSPPLVAFMGSKMVREQLWPHEVVFRTRTARVWMEAAGRV